jgi:hypothetical protein
MKEYHVTCLHCGKSWKTREESAETMIEKYSHMTTCFAGAHAIPDNRALSQYVYFTEKPFSMDKKPTQEERHLFNLLKRTSLSMFLVEKDLPLLTAVVTQRALLRELFDLCDTMEEKT